MSTSPSSSLPVRRWPRRILLGLGVLVVLLLLDAVWAGLTTAHDLSSARDRITAGADALIHGKVAEAANDFDQARHDADTAAKLGDHPSGFLAGALPFIGDNAHAVEDLARAGSLTAQAGQTLTAAAERVRWNGSGIPGVSSGSGLSASVLQKMAPDLATAHSSLTQAQAILDSVSTAGLLEPVQNAVLTARGELAGRTDLVGSATDVAKLVPDLLKPGARYLLIVQNPGEARGTGGFMGFYGTLVSDGTHLNLTRFVPADGKLVPPVSAPPDYVARYKDFQSLIDLRQSNYSPDLPTVAGVITQMAQERGWGHYDGIFMVDTIWMQYILEATGPISVAGLSGPLTSDSVVDVLGKQIPALPEGQSNKLQGEIGRAVWGAIQTRNLSPTAFATALSRSVAERHMQLWSANPSEETLIRRLGAAGNADLGKNPLYVVWNALSASKVAVYEQRSIDVDVTLHDQGTALVTETLTLTNTAPSAPPSDLLGDGTDYAVGTFQGYVSVYEPAKLQGRPTYQANAPTVTGQEREFGHPVAVGVVGAPSGGSMTWSVTYVAPGAATKVGNGWEYRLDFIPQPTFSPLPVNITIHLPSGDIVTDRSPGVAGGNGTVTYRNSPAVPTPIWIKYGAAS